MSVYDAVHKFMPDASGRCTGGWLNNASDWVQCRSRDRWSTLHDDPEAAFRELHSHGGGDCMCFEDERGPTYAEALRAFVRDR